MLSYLFPNINQKRSFTMKKIIVFCIFAIFILMAACSNEVISYKGESENWLITSTVQSNDESSNYQYTIKYKGKNLSSIEKVNYKFMSENIHAKEEAPFEPVIERNVENREPFKDEEEFIVEIDWNGETERVTVNKE
jgi:hypothetical protein